MVKLTQRRWLALWLLLILLVACTRSESPGDVPSSDLTRIEASPTPQSEVLPTPTLMPTVRPSATPLPTTTPEPAPKKLTVCTAAEPADLYLYGTEMAVQRAVLHGIYENLYTNLDYAYQAQGLEKLPSIADGDAEIETVVVSAGDRVVTADGAVVYLTDGVEVIDREGQRVTFAGDTLLMEQVVADFTFEPLVWEDGTPVTADDSVFSFEIAADPESRIDHFKTERTASYEATGERSVRWRGLPGFRDSEYFLNVWQPLPRHLWGSYSARELAGLEEALRRPLSNGPFRVAEWVAGDRITLVPNEQYYRAAEGLPYLDEVTFLALYEPQRVLSSLSSGLCDIAYEDSLDLRNLAELRSADDVTTYVQTGQVFEHLDFGINPIPEYAEARPDWFEDVRVRQGIAQCINRPALLEAVGEDTGEILHAYVPEMHPLYPAEGARWPYDPAAGNALIDEAGFLDQDGDGVRESQDGSVPFAVTLMTTSGGELRPLLADMITVDLAACGIDVTVDLVPAEIFFATEPAGPIFGRQFDLAIFAWVMHTNPVCEIYETREVPGEPPSFPMGWSGNNVTGWSNPDFDAACDLALVTVPGEPGYADAHREALRLFMEQIPSLPLFGRLRVAASQPHVVSYDLNPSEPSSLWNLYEIDILSDP